MSREPVAAAEGDGARSIGGVGRAAARLRRGARRLTRAGTDVLSVRRVLATALLVAVAVGAAVWSGRDRGPAEDVTGAVVVGATDGTDVAAYLSASAAELAAGADVPVSALVSFDAYLTPDRVTVLLAAVPGAVVERVSVRVPLPGVQTELVTLVVVDPAVDVAAGMRRTAERKDLTADELPTDRADDVAVLRAEAAAYRSLCACAYGAVVRAAPAVLRRLAAADGVRAVDPAPEVTRPDRAVFVPLRPEDTVVVTRPADSAAPAVPVVPPGAGG